MITYLNDIGGKTEVGEFRTLGGCSWVRDDTYTDRQGNIYPNQGCFVTGKGDTSEPWSIYDNYDRRCNCCWLHIHHSTDKHNADLARGEG